MQNKLFRLPLLIVLPILAALAVALFNHQPTPKAQTPPAIISATYTVDSSIFPNPERGFFKAYQPTGGGLIGQQDTPHPPLSANELRALRRQPEAITLIRDSILIPRRYWHEPISPEYLNELQANFDAVREAGLKSAPRFHYDWSMQNRDPEEATINRHLDQLKPLLQKNADVIAWVQGGLFGGTGEQNASDHNYVYEKHAAPGSSIKWQGLSETGRRILLKELQLIPDERMMTVRYPRLKWDLFGWSTPVAMQRALTAQTAFSGAGAARVGFYNDGFMGSPEHYAMFQLPGEANFTAQDAEFVIHEGEISDASEYKLKPRQVVLDMEKYHQTALNAGGDAWEKVSAVWKRNGDYDEIARRMGYRFRLETSSLPPALRAGSTFTLRLAMKNDGFARAMNPRAIEVVLRDKEREQEYSISVDRGRGNRLWLPGPGETKTLEISAGIPAAMPVGEYEVFLNLPDPAPSLRGRPEYSIRLANQNVWEAATGYNKLRHVLRITRDGAGQEYSGRDFFSARER